MLDLTRLFRTDKNATEYSAGDTIIKVGDVSLEMFIVLEGQIDIIAHDKVLETVNPGGMFGELALIDASPRSASAVARSNCRIVPVDQKRFQFLVQQHPYFSLHVMRVLAERLRRTTESAA